MQAPIEIKQRSASRAPFAAGVIALVALAGVLPASRAQQYIGQNGRLLDANPQFGGPRYNYGRVVSPLEIGNLVASGNIGRGFSLHSYSPIGAPTAFEAPTGSGALSNFIRDSVGVGDQNSPFGGLLPQAFFDPTRTAPTAGYLHGYYGGQLPQPVSPFDERVQAVRDMSSDLPRPYGSPPAPRPDLGRMDQTYSEVLGSRLDTELSSAIFGIEKPSAPSPTSGTQALPGTTYLPRIGEETGAPAAAQLPADGIHAPLDLRLQPGPDTLILPTPLDVASRNDALQALVDNTGPAWLQSGTAEAQAQAPFGQPGPQPGERAYAAGFPPPGGDVFADMGLALALASDPESEQYLELLTGSLENPDASPAEAMGEQQRATQAAQTLVQRMLDSPVATFVGHAPTRVNEELAEAETALQQHRYYDAEQHYERVQILDPANALAQVGRGYALLGAGEYISAVQSLIAGLQRFPEMARFHIDLTAVMGGGETVDIRRADLMKLLARNEDPRLRFLLGYIEIHTGMNEFGMENLRRAAENAAPGSLISRYPQLLERSRTRPAPPPAPGAAPAPAGNPPSSDAPVLPRGEPPQ